MAYTFLKEEGNCVQQTPSYHSLLGEGSAEPRQQSEEMQAQVEMDE